VNKKFRLVIFDFDGTLADSFPFFTSAFNRLAEQHGFKSVQPEMAPAFRHYSARKIMEWVGMPVWKLPFVGKSYISMMRENTAGIPLFDSVGEMLLDLWNKGVCLAIVSSNSYDNVSEVLGPENIRLFSHFECGMSMFGKAARINKVLKKSGISRSEAIYIGDQDTDVEAAHKARIAFGAVRWGYGSIESLRAQSPEVEFDNVAAIKGIA
jgi:phosphoglycolate phosphatase